MPKLIKTDKPRIALVTGITGQDGGYLAALLLDKGYLVHGMARDLSKLSSDLFAGIPDLSSRLILHSADMANGDQLYELVKEISPDEVYNLAAQTHIQASFDQPAYTTDVNATGPMRLLDAIHKLDPLKRIRFYQASSSEMFGDAKNTVQDESTPFHPLNPYAISKHAAFEAAINFREVYGVHASNGILFNHESPYRNPRFVTRKITMSVAALHLGQGECLRLGNLDTRRDWGHAADYVQGMWLMLQQDQPDDYVLATGENHSVREFVELAFREIGRELIWQGSGVEERATDASSGDLLVSVDPQFFRPADLNATLGDASKARSILGWKNHHDFGSLVREMVAADIARLVEALALNAPVSAQE